MNNRITTFSLGSAVAACSLAVSAANGDGCTAARLDFPQAGSTLTTRQLPLAFANPSTGGESFAPRLLIEARIPEGRTLTTFDLAKNSTLLSVPDPAPQRRVNLKVAALSGCAEKTQNALFAAHGVHLFIDSGLTCSPAPRVELAADRKSIQWSPAAGAVGYEIRLFDRSAKPLRSAAVSARQTGLAIDDAAAAQLITQCASGHSAPSFILRD